MIRLGLNLFVFYNRHNYILMADEKLRFLAKNNNVIFNTRVYSYFPKNSNACHRDFNGLNISQSFYHSVSISLFNKLWFTSVNVDFKMYLEAIIFKMLLELNEFFM